MRLNYYKFPDTVDAHTRYLNGCVPIAGTGDRETGKCTEAEFIVMGISISGAKKLLKQYGGSAWTEHCERDGTVFEVTEIKFNSNNSKFKYNKHL